MSRDRTILWSRTLHRRVHLVLAAILGVYLYSPLGEIQTAELVVQAVLFPLLAATGILLWRGGQIRRWITTRTTAAESS